MALSVPSVVAAGHTQVLAVAQVRVLHGIAVAVDGRPSGGVHLLDELQVGEGRAFVD